MKECHKMGKKLLLSVLLLCFIFMNNNINAENKINEELDALDIVFISMSHLVANDKANEDMIINKCIPLYDLSDDINAYYILFSSGEYVIVNNDVKVPAVLEFGSDYSLEAAILEKETGDTRIYYFGSGLFVTQNKENEYLSFYSDKYSKGDLSVIDENNDSFLEKLDLRDKVDEIGLAKQAFMKKNSINKSEVANTISIVDLSLFKYKNNSSIVHKLSSDPWFFLVNSSDLPSSTYIYDNIPSYSYLTYGTTGEFTNLDGVQNHCAATSAFNMVLYYRYVLGNPISSAERESVFLDIHSEVGNGPVLPLQYRNRLTDYIENYTSYSIDTAKISKSWSNYKDQITANKMTYFVVWPALLKAHMINGIGWREYSTGEHYARIADGWYSSVDRWYLYDEALYQMGYVKIY
jgi:hypothetical protein